MQEKVIDTKICKHCKKDFFIYENDAKFLDKISPIFGTKKYTFPISNYCPDCRRINRLVWRNKTKLFRRNCDATGKEILSFYDENLKHPVYELEYWNSDKWDPLEYGIDYDFSKTFFEQFKKLKNKVPHFSRNITRAENSKYSNNASDLKNCYLCFNGGTTENSLYTISFNDSKKCIDCYGINLCDNCYECVDIYNCNLLFYSQDCEGCFNSYFLKNCINCENCFLSKNLVGKKYYIKNKKYSKEEYFKEIKKVLSKNTIKQLKKIFKNFKLIYPEKNIHSLNIENSIGDYIGNSKDIFESYEIYDSENLRYCFSLKEDARDSFDIDIFGRETSLSYNSCVLGHKAHRIYCCFDCWGNVENLLYCSSCLRNIKNCFGCVGLHDGYEYCIFNKQYTKEEYFELVPKIIEHMISTNQWGKFFPPSLSSYGYNQTEAIEFNNLTRKEAKTQGFNWSDYETPAPKVEKIIPASKLPENIKDIPDDILNWAIECKTSKKPFIIIKSELEFYRKHDIPIPKKHPDQRHQDRMKLRNPRKLFNRKCKKCGVDIKTSYSRERKEIVYCEECYNKEIY